jgi:hypothetical protein
MAPYALSEYPHERAPTAEEAKLVNDVLRVARLVTGNPRSQVFGYRVDELQNALKALDAWSEGNPASPSHR